MAETKRCPHCGVSRDTFADEGSWLAHLQHEASMARAAHRQQVEARQPKRKRGQKAPLSPALQTWRRMKMRKYNRRSYWKDHAATRAYYNAYSRAWRAANPERARAMWRRHAEKHREERNLARRVYYWDHYEQEQARRRAYNVSHRKQITARHREWRHKNREHLREWGRRHYVANRERELATDKRYRQAHREAIAARKKRYNEAHRDERLAYFREYNQTRRDKHYRLSPEVRRRHALNERKRRARSGDAAIQETTYRTREDIQATARALEDAVIEARDAGFTWKEIAELLERKEKACVKAYRRAMQRRQAEQGDSEQSA